MQSFRTTIRQTAGLRKPVRQVLVLLTLTLLTALPAGASVDSAAGPVSADFTLPSAAGSNIRLSEYRGQVVMINFWASWCGPCRQEMPLLDALYKRYKDTGFVILGVNVEPDSRAAEKLLQDIPVTFPVLFDRESKVSKQFDVDAMPSTVMLDRDGRIRYVHRGYKPGYERAYQTQIRELIRE